MPQRRFLLQGPHGPFVLSPGRRLRAALERTDLDAPSPPAGWGGTRSHLLHGALHRWFLLLLNRGHGGRRHSELPAAAGAWLDTRRLLLRPVIALGRMWEPACIRREG